MMSAISAIRRFASLQMRPAKSFTSSGRARPSRMISAKPEMEVSGVLSSWETLAENSLRLISAVYFSVVSSSSSTMPMQPSFPATGLASSW